MTFKFPLQGTKEDWTVTYEFDLSKWHYGIDWSNYKKGSTLNAPIYASASGKVVKSEYGDVFKDGKKVTSSGYNVEIDHGKDIDGYYYGTRYQHMNSASPLKVGDVVKAGDIVGYVGGSGDGGYLNNGKSPSYGAHLHFEILKYTTPITGDPGQRGNVNPRDYIYNTQPTPTPAPTIAETYELYVAVPTYNNAANAKNKTNANKETYGPGIYYIYNKYSTGYNGMYNITTDPTGNSAGAWINPADNIKPAPVRKYKLNDMVSFKYIFSSSTSTKKLTPETTQGKITRVLTEDVANPYLIDEGNIGWTNEESITGLVVIETPKPVEEEKKPAQGPKIEVENPVEEPKVEESSNNTSKSDVASTENSNSEDTQTSKELTGMIFELLKKIVNVIIKLFQK